MKIRQITIRNYKAISEITFRLDKPLIPIVGINEAGKSTILEAIMAFTPDNDDLNDGKHLNPTNIYARMSDAQITAEIIFESQAEIKSLPIPSSDNARRAMVSNIISNLNGRWTQGEKTFTVTRHLPSQEYSFVSPVSDQHFERGRHETTDFIKSILQRLPQIIYFENFIDNLPNRVLFVRGQTSPNEQYQLEEYTSIWQSTIQEFFERSNIDFAKYLTNVEQEKESSYDYIPHHKEDLDKVEEQLNLRIAKEWLRLSGEENPQAEFYPLYQFKLIHDCQKETQLTDEQEKSQYKHTFVFRLEDRLSPDQPARFNLEDRSKGYQWFINFIFKLAFNPNYRDNRAQVVFLIDEPGSYLHPLAQERLLDRLIELAKSTSTSIIYTTHLPQLVNPSKIRLHDCLIAYRNDNQIALSQYGQINDSQSLGALTTLHNAMRINLPGLMFPNTSPPFVVTEGITDFYVYSMVKEHTEMLKDCEISIIPGHGVDQLQPLISLAIAWSDPYVVVFDKDEQADKAIKRYGDVFGEEQRSKYWIQIDNKDQAKPVALERLFSDADQKRLLQLTSASNLKRGFEILYFSDVATKQEFWAKIDQETQENFSLVAQKIKDIVGLTINQETDMNN